MVQVAYTEITPGKLLLKYIPIFSTPASQLEKLKRFFNCRYLKASIEPFPLGIGAVELQQLPCLLPANLFIMKRKRVDRSMMNRWSGS